MEAGRGTKPGTNIITTVVTATDSFDLVHPVLSATNSFTAIVRPSIVLTAASWLGNDQFQFSFNTTAGQNYTFNSRPTSSIGHPLSKFQGDGDTFTVIDPNAGDTQRFYRVISP